MAQFNVKKEVKFHVFDRDAYENIATFDSEVDATKYALQLENTRNAAYERGKKDGRNDAFKEINESKSIS